MPRYLFLDNWVYSQLTKPGIENRLVRFIQDRGYTVLLTPLSQVELYNHNWERAGPKDRAALAARFLSQVPCVIVNPGQVHDAEIASYLNPLPKLPIALDFREIPDYLRAPTLLSFLRRDEIFLRHNKDIAVWSAHYEELKDTWLADVDRIIERAVENGNLKRDDRGNFIELNEHRELFLLSLDLRLANPSDDVAAIVAKVIERAEAGEAAHLTAVRLSSLCFWYAYVNVDNADRIKRSGSDVGDIFHISLMLYCDAFTTDGSMHRMLNRIRVLVGPINCEVITRSQLDRYLKGYP